MKKHFISAVCAFLPVLGVAGGYEDNGSFEKNTLANGSWVTLANLTDWVGGAHGIELRNNVAGQAMVGSNFVELDTDQNSSMSQNLMGAASVLGTVILSFYYSDRPNTTAATNGLIVNFGGQVITLAGHTNSTTANHWVHYSGIFNLTKKTGDTLTFRAAGISDGFGTALDRVTVVAVPEPETLALMLAGLGMLGVTARRRNFGR